MGLRTVFALSITSAALLVPASAGLGATTIGVPNPAGGTLDNSSGCGGACTYLPALTSGAAFTAPSRGVLVRWRIVSDSSNNPVTLRVLRPAGGQFTAVGNSAVEHTTGAVTADAFATRLRMKAGDALGLDASEALVFKPMAASGVHVRWVSPVLADGAASPFSGQNPGGGAFELQINADLEPDADDDGFGDQSQDGCPGDAARQTPPCATGPANPGGTPPATPGDKTPPVLSGMNLKPSSFRLGKTTRISFRLSETSRVRLAFARLVPGRRRGARCLAQTRRVSTGRRCTAALARGSVTVRAQGAQSIPFDGRVTRSLLAPGRYRIVATATDLAGNASRAATATFVLRPRAPRHAR